jgi:hypothetical protein
MRSKTLLAMALLSGCGNYSTDDVRFLAAVPTTEMLKVDVPASAAVAVSAALALDGQQAPAACGIGTAEIWVKARATGNDINAGVGVVLWLADLIRTLEPSRRATDSREWGPFDDRNHTGFEDLITLTRQTSGCASDVSVCYDFALQARPKGQGPFTSILVAHFQGGSAEHGHGSLDVDFKAMQDLGMNDADSPGGTMTITYSRTGDPRSIDLQLHQPTAKLAEFDYQWRRYTDGHGSFLYQFADIGGNTVTVNTRFDAAGEGRADVDVRLASNGTHVGYSECWNSRACVSWVDDALNFTGLCPVPRPQWCTVSPPTGACAVQ